MTHNYGLEDTGIDGISDKGLADELRKYNLFFSTTFGERAFLNVRDEGIGSVRLFFAFEPGLSDIYTEIIRGDLMSTLNRQNYRIEKGALGKSGGVLMLRKQQ